MKRNGKKLAVLPDGHPRRLADGRNAWRKMNDSQRAEFATFAVSEMGLGDSASTKRVAIICDRLGLWKVARE